MAIAKYFAMSRVNTFLTSATIMAILTSSYSSGSELFCPAVVSDSLQATSATLDLAASTKDKMKSYNRLSDFSNQNRTDKEIGHRAQQIYEILNGDARPGQNNIERVRLDIASIKGKAPIALFLASLNVDLRTIKKPTYRTARILAGVAVVAGALGLAGAWTEAPRLAASGAMIVSFISAGFSILEHFDSSQRLKEFRALMILREILSGSRRLERGESIYAGYTGRLNVDFLVSNDSDGDLVMDLFVWSVEKKSSGSDDSGSSFDTSDCDDGGCDPD
ncbi:MAG: hypothetical protein K2X47_04835 [Bdellovibrionales bacterium]|nr:hypothetical protein [Bdellovibrionales bacterium]